LNNVKIRYIRKKLVQIMTRIKRLTKGEEAIMQYIWQLERCTVADILEKLSTPKSPHSSISSIVRILERKGFVGHKSYGRTYEYFPLITKEEYSRGSLLTLIHNYFNGSTPKAGFLPCGREETTIEELQEIIKQLKKKS
jgi:predicted transcriptional regulator